MSSSIIVRDIDPRDKPWLEREARQVGVSMEDFVQSLIQEGRNKSELRPKPSEAFARYYGKERGVDLPPPAHIGYILMSRSREKRE